MNQDDAQPSCQGTSESAMAPDARPQTEAGGVGEPTAAADQMNDQDEADEPEPEPEPETEPENADQDEDDTPAVTLDVEMDDWGQCVVPASPGMGSPRQNRTRTATGADQDLNHNELQHPSHRTTKFAKFKQRMGWEPTAEEIVREHGRRFHHASELLLERLFRYLSQLPEEDLQTDYSERGFNGMHVPTAGNAQTSQLPPRASGITLPASAVAWLSSQLYPPQRTRRARRQRDPLDPDTASVEGYNSDGDGSTNAADSLVPDLPHDDHPHPQTQSRGNGISPLWMGIHMRDRLALLKFLLPRATHVRVAGNIPWPPALDDATLKQHIRRQRQQRQRQERRQNHMVGQDLHCSTVSVHSAITMDSMTPSYMGPMPSSSAPRSGSNTPSLQRVQDYFHQLQNQPIIDLRVFPRLQALVFEQVPASWIHNLHALRPTLQVLRVDRGCVYNLNRMLSNGASHDNQGNVAYHNVTHLKLSKCDLNSLSGLRSMVLQSASGAARPRRTMPPFARFPNLQVLNLSHNHLSDQQDALTGLSQCVNLNKIDLSYNNLSSMNKIHMNIGNISVLNLSHNQLTTVQGIDRLYALKHLDLYNNQLQSIGNVASLARLPELVILNLKANPLAVAETEGTTETTTFRTSSNTNSERRRGHAKNQSHRLDMWILFAHHRFEGSPITYELCKQFLPTIDSKLPSRSDVQKLQQGQFAERITTDAIHEVLNDHQPQLPLPARRGEDANRSRAPVGGDAVAADIAENVQRPGQSQVGTTVQRQIGDQQINVVTPSPRKPSSLIVIASNGNSKRSKKRRQRKSRRATIQDPMRPHENVARTLTDTSSRAVLLQHGENATKMNAADNDTDKTNTMKLGDDSSKKDNADATTATSRQTVILSTRRSVSFTVKDVLRLSMRETKLPTQAPPSLHKLGHDNIDSKAKPPVSTNPFDVDDVDEPTQTKFQTLDLDPAVIASILKKREMKASQGEEAGADESKMDHDDTANTPSPNMAISPDGTNPCCDADNKQMPGNETNDANLVGASAGASDSSKALDVNGDTEKAKNSTNGQAAPSIESRSEVSLETNNSAGTSEIAVEGASNSDGDGGEKQTARFGATSVETKSVQQGEQAEQVPAQGKKADHTSIDKSDQQSAAIVDTAHTKEVDAHAETEVEGGTSSDGDTPSAGTKMESNQSQNPAQSESQSNDEQQQPQPPPPVTKRKVASVRLYPGASRVHEYDIFSQDWDALVEQAAQGLIIDPIRNPLGPKFRLSNKTSQGFGAAVDLLGDAPVIAMSGSDDMTNDLQNNQLQGCASATQHSADDMASIATSDYTRTSMLPDIMFQDDFSVPSSLGANRDDFLAFNKFQLAEDNSTYDGPGHCLGMPVSTNLDLYFRSFVFPASIPDLTQEMFDTLNEEQHWQLTFLQYPRVQLWPEDRRYLEVRSMNENANNTNSSSNNSGANRDMSDILDRRENLVRVWSENIIPCGRQSQRRLLQRKSQRVGFHGDLLFGKDGPETYAEARKVILCLSSSALYVVLDHDVVTTKQDRKRKFPRPIPKGSFFRDAPWPHAVARHPLETLSKITIGFGFQRLTLHFRSASFRSSDPFTYVLLVSNKMEAISILKDLQNCAKAYAEEFDNTSYGSVPADFIPIENDDRNVLEALALTVAPEVVGIALHYQILKQKWKRGGRQTVRRVCVVTDSKIFLLDEDYAGDNLVSKKGKGSAASTIAAAAAAAASSTDPDSFGKVRYKLVDEATLKQIAEVQAADADPKAMTIIINPLSRLSRTHRWRLVCRDSDGAERLVADLRKAIEMAD